MIVEDICKISSNLILLIWFVFYHWKLRCLLNRKAFQNTYIFLFKFQVIFLGIVSENILFLLSSFPLLLLSLPPFSTPSYASSSLLSDLLFFQTVSLCTWGWPWTCECIRSLRHTCEIYLYVYLNMNFYMCVLHVYEWMCVCGICMCAQQNSEKINWTMFL